MKFLPDYIEPGVQILLVGINPGLRSASLGHHFAGHTNRFWKLLYESRLITEPLSFREDWRVPEWGLGLTNMIPRPTAGCADLNPAEYQAACEDLKRKVEQFRPPILALLGVTLGRIISKSGAAQKMQAATKQSGNRVGAQPLCFGDAQVFVLPNPSGRNAHYSYQSMLKSFQELRRFKQQNKWYESSRGKALHD